MQQYNLIESAMETIRNDDLNTLKDIARSIPEDRISEVLSCQNKIGRNLLSQSVIKTNISIVKFLLEDCHVNPVLKFKDDFVFPFLFSNAYKGECEIIKFLMELGININIFEDYCCSPLYMACGQKNLTMVRFLIEKGEDVNESKCLIRAIQLEETEITNYLIECGADVNIKDKYNDTPLHICGAKRNLKLFKILVEKGATKCVNAKGLDQLQAAAFNGRDEIFAFYSSESIHTRDEILDCLELQGIRSFIINDFSSSIRIWKSVLKERSQLKITLFLEKIQRDMHQNQDYDHWFDDRENSAIHSMIILERLFGLRTWVVQYYFQLIVDNGISIPNTQFWDAFQDFELKSPKCDILRICNEMFARYFLIYVQSVDYNNINSSLLNIAMRFIDIDLGAEDFVPANLEYIPLPDIDAYMIEMAGIILIVCVNSIKDNAADFDTKLFHRIIGNFLKMRQYSSHNCLHNLILYSRNSRFPKRFFYESFEMICKIRPDKVNNLNQKRNSPLHEALLGAGNEVFIDILLKYGAVTDTKNHKGQTIRNLATVYGILDVCTGSSSLQILVGNYVRNQKDLPLILRYFIEFHCHIIKKGIL